MCAGSFLRGKVATAWHCPPTPNGTKVKTGGELYLYAPLCASNGMLWGKFTFRYWKDKTHFHIFLPLGLLHKHLLPISPACQSVQDTLRQRSWPWFHRHSTPTLRTFLLTVPTTYKHGNCNDTKLNIQALISSSKGANFRSLINL